MLKMQTTFLVVGGGIAGVTCVEHLAYLAPEKSAILLTSSPLVKSVSEIVPLTKMIYRFNVDETSAEGLRRKHPSLTVVRDTLARIVSAESRVRTEGGVTIQYQHLCLCTGAVPDPVPRGVGVRRVLGIRDTGSVKEYLKTVRSARRLLVIGNGGIASELVYATKGVQTVWAIKDGHISSTFVDPGAAEFFRTCDNFGAEAPARSGVVKRMTFSEEDGNGSEFKAGAALGPDWLKDTHISGGGAESSLEIIYRVEVEDIVENGSGNWPLTVKLTDGRSIECDLVVSATGVSPNSKIPSDVEFRLASDGGLSVDWKMETSAKNIYAAGDVCHAAWDLSPHWFQMRLWTQAHQMGGMAAKSMALKEEATQDFCFELFTHTTSLFGYPVVLLGKFNGQGLGNDYEILIRTTPNLEYIKFVLVNGRLQGAMLIGETGLEETCENLILNQIDLSPFGDDILNPDIDIEDYFD